MQIYQNNIILRKINRIKRYVVISLYKFMRKNINNNQQINTHETINQLTL